MKIVIIEDEIIAAESLKKLIMQIDNTVEVMAMLKTVEDSIAWFNSNAQPDLIFVDIHLADGSSFSIFEKTDVKCPVVFTTAYDEYALKAFELNSIDYLLKPINKNDLQRAIDKYKSLIEHNSEYSQLTDNVISMLEKKECYREHFLIPERDKLVPLAAKDIAYIYIDLKIVKAVSYTEKVYYMNNTLDELMNMLNPKDFFRANRQFIIAHQAVKDISLWFGNKISVNMKVPVDEKIIISKARVTEFKRWYSGI